MLARLENGAVAEFRDLDVAEVPEHKRHLWHPVVYEGNGPIEQQIIELDKVRIVRGERPLTEVQAEYRQRVDEDAERCRLRFITPGAGMAMTYQEKFAQANAIHAMGEDAANALSAAEREAQFPTLAASIGLEAATLWGCAQIVLDRYAQFAALSLVIERTRLSAKAAIAAASNVAGVRAAYEAVAWPTP